jgi:hypothetical protein
MVEATLNSEAHRLRQQMLNHQFEATHQKTSVNSEAHAVCSNKG